MDAPEQPNPVAGAVAGEPAAAPPLLSPPGDPPVASFSIPSGAGFGIRVLARLVDTLYGMVIGLLTGICLGIVFAVLAKTGKIDAEWIERVGHSSLLDYLLSGIGGFLYHSLAEGMGGVTIGKLVCGLRVVRRDGGAVDLEGGLKRSLAYFWDAFFFGVVAYTRMERGPLRQRYGDAWADTVVVKNSVYRSPDQQGAGRVVIGVLLGSFLWASLVALTIVVKVF